jgi:hypothetical protein
VIVFNCFVGNCAGQVDGQEDRVHLPAERVERGFQEEASVVEGVVGEDLGIAERHSQEDALEHQKLFTYSLRIELTTALVKGEAVMAARDVIFRVD